MKVEDEIEYYENLIKIYFTSLKEPDLPIVIILDVKSEELCLGSG